MAEEFIDILLVEDSTDDAAFFIRAAEAAKLGVQIRRACDGVEALSMIFGGDNLAGAPRLQPRLILLDLKMPRLGGVEVLRALKTNPQTRSIPVVVLSSSNEKRDLNECYQLGANSYLVKPMDFDTFVHIAQTAIRYWLHLNHAPQY
jgi:two-component system, response regulator